MKKYNVSLLLILFWSNISFGGVLIKTLQKGVAGDKFFTTATDEKKNQLSVLNKKLKELEKESESFLKEAKMSLAEFATQIKIVTPEIKKDSRNEEFLNSKLSILTELYQVIKDRQQGYKQTLEFTQDHIKLLKEYLEDSKLENYLKEFHGDRQSIYSFEDLQDLNKLIISQKNKVTQLEKQEKNSISEMDSRSASSNSAEKIYKKKQEEFKGFAKDVDAKGPEEMFGFEHGQKIVLLKLQERLYYEKKELARIRFYSTKRKVGHIKTKLFIEKLKFKKLEKTVDQIRPFVNVRDEDISVIRAELNKKKQKSLSIKGKYRRDEEALSKENELRMKELKRLAKQYNILLGLALDDWSIEPKQTSSSYFGLSIIGNINSKYLFIERTKELLEAQISLENEKLRYQEMLSDVKITFHALKTERSSSEDWRDNEIKKYSLPGVEIDATISRFKERENAIAGFLNSQKSARENIKFLLEDIHSKRATVFKGRSKEFNQVIVFLKEARIRVEQQIAVIERIVGVYRDIVVTGKNSHEQIGFIVNELKAATGILKRSEEAIKLQEIKNILPDVKRFVFDFYTYGKQFSIKSFFRKIYYGFIGGFGFIWLLVRLLLLIIGLFLFKIYVNSAIRIWLERIKSYRGFRIFSFLLQVCLNFIVNYYNAISIWIVLFVSMKIGLLPDPGLQMLFYLFSIPYFLYLANRFLYQFIFLNEENDYFILTRQFQSRFYFIISTLIYSTVIIQFFRTAFLLGPYKESGLPIVLLALNFIILQVCLIFVITKEQILSLIPETTESWKYIYAQVDKFFYFILAFIIAIIVMINPYVGFGRLVLHVLSRLFLSLLFLPFFYWAQLFLKKVSSKLFFFTRDGVVKERFSSAKSWYGLFVIISFVAFILIGAVFGAKIWGWSITYRNIVEWMRTAIFFGEGGKTISAVSFFQILTFIVSGFLLAFAFNKFVLKRIFELLLVEMGIQHAMIGLARYLIITAVVMIGFESVGLGGLTKYILASLLAVGWVVKEPLGDLVAYFILLIQRPLKIGDYVQIDQKTSGVVRRITPRSIVLRQKNSTTIVVPNSQVLSKAVVNWNYVSGFIALNDIVISINYKEDPENIIKIIKEAVDSHPKILKSPNPVIRLESFGEYGFKFLVRGYISSHLTLDMWDIAASLRIILVKSLREKGIEIAIPIWHTTADEILINKKRQLDSVEKIEKKETDQ